MKTIRLMGLTHLMILMGCSCQAGSSSTNQQGNELSTMETARITIGEASFEVWVARTASEREKGLMFVNADQMTDLPDGVHRGMLFVFESERVLGFWMRNTYIPLDIAYARTDGTIVKMHTMTPLDESSYSSVQPSRYALEVNANLFDQLDIAEGATITLPDSITNPQE
ncbi:MAG: hypothetical protein HJJLKODD_01579 [Phycisphaerae bacterium]|nr:hypothetical protein [Phycisphaerae bacterium]